MRLALTFPYSFGVPGGGTLDCLQLARELAALDIEVCVLPVLSGGHTRFPRPSLPPEHHGLEVIEELRAAGVEVRCVQPNRWHYLLEGLPMKRALQKLHAEKPLDAVLGYTFEMLFLREFCSREGIVYAINAAGSYRRDFVDLGHGLKAKLKLWKARRSLARPMSEADVVLARSEFTRQEVIALTGVRPERARVVHLGVEDSLADLPREAEASIERFFFFGSFRPEKGLEDALVALGHVARESEHPWTFRVAGWGDIEHFKARAKELGIAERVEFLGPLDRAELRAALAWAQVAIMPSHGESFGLANAEALTAGVPVIAFDVAAVPEVVQQERAGWLVPLGDQRALAAAIKQAIEAPNDTFQRGIAGRSRMLDLFSWKSMALKTQAAIEAEMARIAADQGTQ